MNEVFFICVSMMNETNKILNERKTRYTLNLISVIVVPYEKWEIKIFQIIFLKLKIDLHWTETEEKKENVTREKTDKGKKSKER